MSGNVIRGPWRALPRRKGWPPSAAYLEARERPGHIHCGDDGDIYDSEFRRTAGIRRRHECQLRQLAREQAREAANLLRFPAVASTAVADVLAGIKIPPQTCPGEFGAGGAWQEHCKISTEGNDR
jgi:hypothetical protein